MPIPGPINSHRRRSLGVASARRGYHVRGTDTVRPSRNSTIKLSPVTVTSFAVAISIAGFEVLMPCLLIQLHAPAPSLRPWSVLRAQIRGCTPVELDPARISRLFVRAKRGCGWVHLDRLRKRRSGTDRFAEPSDSRHRFCQLLEKPATFHAIRLRQCGSLAAAAHRLLTN